MNKLLLILITLTLLSFKTDSSKWVINQKGDIISVDRLGKVYQVTDNAVVKYSDKGVKIANFSILNNGKITLIDTQNPLQTILFFKEQQEAIVLDNMLGEANSINFTDYFEWVDLICASNRDNSFWLYSINNQELIKTDKNLTVISRYPNLAQVLSIDIKPSQLVEVNETIYLFDKQNGLILFDVFGNYKKRITLKDAEKVVIENDVVYYLSGNSINYYNLISFNKGILHTSATKIIDFSIFNSSLYLQTESNLTCQVINTTE